MKIAQIVAIGMMMASSMMAETVYLTATGKTFHKSQTCMALSNAKKVLTADRSAAEQHGLKQCGICYRIRKAGKPKADNAKWAK